MAFNPFHAFRKHQKVVFATLTIVCMLTFVMAGGSFAGGDFFSELTRWISGRSRTQEVATIYGKRISDRELSELRLQRRLANEFMKLAIWQAHNNIIAGIRAKTQSDQLLTRDLGEIFFYRDLAGQQPSFARMYLQQLPRYSQQVQNLLSTMVALKKTAEAEMLSPLQVVLQQEAWLFQQPKDDLYPEDDLYFGGSNSEQGLVDFMIWRHQADRLGIQLTPSDIGRQYKYETLSSAPSAAQLLAQLRGPRADSTAEQAVLTALGDEFRVRMAQAALVGYNPSGHIGQVPASITPYEFWEYYRTNRTELSLKLLPVPVQKFIPEVKDKASEAELQALFEKYKDEEYAPNKDTPGFKQPRRMKLEWVSASPDSDTYRKQAQQWLLSLAAATPGNPLLPMALLEPLVNEYETLKWGYFRASPVTATDFANSFYYYAYFEHPENVAAVLGQIGGTAAVQGSALSSVVAYQSAAVARSEKELAPIVAREAKRRGLSLAGALFIAGTSTQPACAFPTVWQSASKLDQHLPLELVRAQIVRKVRENLANTLLASSLDAFKTELEAIRKEVESKKTKPADAAKRVEKAVQERGWAHGAMTDLHDQHEINQDAKELAPLKEAYMRDAQYRDPKGKLFAQNLLFSTPADRWKPFTPQELASSPSPDTREKKSFLYWKTDDQPAKVLTFAQARSQVEAAWRLEKARVLAKAKAEELAKQARDTNGHYLPVLNEASKQYGTVFDLSGVARWARPPVSSRPDPFAQYQPYTVPDDKIEYPPSWPTFVDPLLDSLNQPGDTIVITNRPKDIYYVVALVRRDAPSMPDFYKETVGNRGLLLAYLERDRQTAYRLAFLRQLRDEANLTINKEGLERIQERPNLQDE